MPSPLLNLPPRSPPPHPHPQIQSNPGVILNRDPDAHKKFLKPSPVASDLVNRCIECGFCESNCPSRDVTLTPRQRIATYKEISRLRGLPAPTAEESARCAGDISSSPLPSSAAADDNGAPIRPLLLNAKTPIRTSPPRHLSPPLPRSTPQKQTSEYTPL